MQIISKILMASINFAIQIIGIVLIFYSFAVILLFDYNHKSKSIPSPDLTSV